MKLNDLFKDIILPSVATLIVTVILNIGYETGVKDGVKIAEQEYAQRIETKIAEPIETAEAIPEVEEKKPEPTAKVTPTPAPTNNHKVMTLKASAYCCENYSHICNNGDATKTATGTTPTVGRTIAVDPSVIPYGSQVTINGHTYIAEDTGGHIKGNRVDILFATHQEALNFGRRTVTAYVKGVRK